MSAELNLDQSEIERLAVGINNAVVGVPDVDEILANTTDNVEMAEQLKNDAEAVQTEAKTQLDIAEKIIKELSNAAVSQDAADLAVAQTRNDIDSARTNLGQVRLMTSYEICTYYTYITNYLLNIVINLRRSQTFEGMCSLHTKKQDL